MGKLVGLYHGPRTIIDHPDYFRALQQEIGLTHFVTGGVPRLSEATRALNPGGENAGSPGNDDDEDLRQTVRLAHEMGLKFWFCQGGWHGMGNRNPERCMVDMHQRPLTEVPMMPYAREQNCVSCCPSDERVNDWLRAFLSEAVAAYEVDGVDLTHFRYTAPAFIHNLFGCACPRCAQLANDRGYDFEAMRRSVLAFWDRIQHLEAAAVRAAGERGLGLLDLPQWLGVDAQLLQWFEFRAGVLAGNLKRLREAACEAAGREIVFGGDTFPPSFSILTGHSYRDFMTWADYTSPLLSHVTVFVLNTFATWADLLCQWVDGLEEADALRFVCRLFGYDHLDLPTRLASYGVPDEVECEVGSGRLYEIVELELWRARQYTTGQIPCYPVIKGARWPSDIVRNLVTAAEGMGHEGIIFQGTASLMPYPGID
jgi:hypothetical protein